MILPSIDLQDGRVVQLAQGRDLKLVLPLSEELLDSFRGFREVQVVDLDAARGRGENGALVEWICARARCRVGGGVRDAERARRLVEAGAAKVVVGTAAFGPRGVDHARLGEIAAAVGRERLVVALDARAGRIAIRGWIEELPIAPEEVLADLAPHCAGVLCTWIDGEGLLGGTDLAWYRRLRTATSLEITAAGGVTTLDEVRTLAALPVHVALGMAIYTGRLDLATLARLDRELA
jgi:phosphoribosylformimino-5-aminoimidazole carboxamide ribonucleotide (ProFAR) isomerase